LAFFGLKWGISCELKQSPGLLFSVGVITWLALVLTDLSIQVSSANNIKPEVPVWLPGVILNLFILALFLLLQTEDRTG
jgi:lipopolysaccharide export LptBFGC system permease protein LptF